MSKFTKIFTTESIGVFRLFGNYFEIMTSINETNVRKNSDYLNLYTIGCIILNYWFIEKMGTSFIFPWYW